MYNLVGLVHVLDEVEDTVGIAALIVVPGHELDEVVRECDAGVGIKDGGSGIGYKVRRDNGILGVAQHALELTLRGGLDGSLDVSILGTLGEHGRQVNNGHVGGGHAEGHAGELSVEGRNDLTHGFGGPGGGRDDVHANGTTSTTPVLEGRTVNGGLGGSGSVHGGHETLLDAKVVVDNLGKGGKTIGGARGVGDNLDVLLVLLVVHANDKHGGVVTRGGRHDDLLGTADEVLGCTRLGEELARRLDDVVGSRSAPLDLGGVKLVGHGDGPAINNKLAVVNDDGAGVAAVDSVVLEDEMMRWIEG